MTIKEFITLFIQTLINGFTTFLGGVAPFMQWLVYLCAGLPVILLGLAAYFWIIRPAKEDAIAQMTAFGNGWLKMKFFITMATILGIVGILVIIWVAPRLGNVALVVAANGMNFTPAAPPINGTAQPLFELPSLVAPTTPIPQDSQTPQPTTTLGATPSSGGTTYKVTDSTGADTRTPQNGVCGDNDPKTGSSIPFGTVVTIRGTWPSQNIPGFRGLTDTGMCVHLSALTQQ
ncbi:MAG: hypothetical protein WCG44_02965 [bacterium]